MSVFRVFRSDRRGSVAIIVGLLFLPMLLALGAAIDYARFEIYRVRLQNAVDRGVLAAAALDQTEETRHTVEEYIGAETMALGIALETDEEVVTNAKTVSATATYAMPTAFLKLIGIQTMDIVVAARAVERRRNIEISLVLDISGSMIDQIGRIRALRPAAVNFVNAMLTDQTRDYTSISLIPYAGQASIGAPLYAALGGVRSHTYSSCIAFTSQDFGGAFPNFAQRAQIAHFTRWNFGNARRPTATGPNRKNAPWCPSDSAAIIPFSNNATALANRINTMETFDGTGTANAMNWAFLLLSPSSRPLTTAANNLGMIDPDFAGRPGNFNDDTVKVIVLMTDGAISEQFRQDTLTAANTANRENYSGIYEPFTPTTIVHQTQNRNTVRADFYRVCNAARAQGIIVFTIALQVATEHQEEMRSCATTPSHFYNVADLDVASAFRSIATAIQKIKLVE